MGRVIKFRAYIKFLREIQNVNELTRGGQSVIVDDYPYALAHDDVELMQFTGLTDKNGIDIYEGDLLNVFYSSGDGEHIHDCIYKAVTGEFGDLQFKFIKLMWEDGGQNQYPISTSLCLQYKSLDTRYNTKTKSYNLCIPDSYGSNRICNDKWKQEDESTYFKVIGNIYENKDLI